LPRVLLPPHPGTAPRRVLERGNERGRDAVALVLNTIPASEVAGDKLSITGAGGGGADHAEGVSAG